MNLVNTLKENNQDFEFYPTSDRMLEKIHSHLSDKRYIHFSVLDIGCGTCKFKKFFDERFSKTHLRIDTYYVFEKSSILREQFDSDTICLGTDFYTNTLIDKEVDVIFCNPPYSDFTFWVNKIISEGVFKYAYLIIPERWKENKETLHLIEKYKLDYEIIGNDDFLDGERKARAKVDIVCFKRFRSDNNIVIENFFKDVLHVQVKEKSESDLSKHFDLILSDIQSNKAEILVDDYNKNYDKVLKNLKAILELDSEILETFGFSTKGVADGLKHKLENMKKEYWKRILDEMQEITSKLTSETRQALFGDFGRLWSTDFTLENIHVIVMFILKRANLYYEDQIIRFFKKLSKKENVKPYKSNQNLFEHDGWRWSSSDHSHFVLDYRIIIKSPFVSTYYYSDTKIENGYEAKQEVEDIATIANNLGFKVNFNDLNQKIDTFGKKYYIHLEDGSIFMEFKNHKNGNMHVKFNTEFTKALNVTIGKLLGWLRSKEDVKEQFPDSIAKGAEKYFDNPYRLVLNTSNLLPKI